MIKSIFIFFLITITGISYAGDDHDEAKKLLESGDILPLENILKKVRALQPGKILDIELESEHNRTIYEIELLTPEGRVLELTIDAKTAELLSTENEN